MKPQFLVFILLCPFKLYSCSGCTQTYATICETIADFEALKYKQPDVIIESPRTDNPPKTSIRLTSFRDVLTLTIVGQINEIVPERDCHYGSALKFINFYNNNVKQLEANSFPRISKIHKLSLVKNRIESIESGTFAGCQPEIIDLSNNKLEIIESHTFTNSWDHNATKVIFLENNRLVNIERHSFPPTLQFLNLKSNSLSFIEREVFEDLKNLEILVLRNNKFSTLPDITPLDRLRTLDLAHNRISRLSGEAFGNKEHIYTVDLSHNKISVIRNNTFQMFSSMRNLNLNYNQIQNLYFLKAVLTNSLVVSLAFNLLTTIDFKVKEDADFSNLGFMLYGNPWSCSMWPSVETYITKKKISRDDCDLKLFGDGKNPFCFCELPKCDFRYTNNSVPILYTNYDSYVEKYLKMELRRKAMNSKNLKECEFLEKKKEYQLTLLSPELYMEICE